MTTYDDKYGAALDELTDAANAWGQLKPGAAAGVLERLQKAAVRYASVASELDALREQVRALNALVDKAELTLRG